MEKFNFINHANIEYIENQFEIFVAEPEKVSNEWRLFFEGIQFAQSHPSTGASSDQNLNVFRLIQRYRDYGHSIADLDPLKLQKIDTQLFDLAKFSLQDADLDQNFNVCHSLLGREGSLRDSIAFLKKTYCGSLAAMVSGCESDVRDWINSRMETSDFKLSKEEKIQSFKSLARAESLERFLHTRFVGTKRFSIEGGDAILPMLELLVTRGTQNQVKEVVLGMAHRGRLNVLANFMGKGLEILLAEFEGSIINKTGYDGDVKYHMGFSADKETPHGSCHISLAFNPSHLEAVAPVVCGMTRAKQRQHEDTVERAQVVPLILHGDAAFAGQGVVSETFQLSLLKGYRVGGSIHIIINNQVGFTTDPGDSRSTRYSSDVSKTIKAPVLLVNGDDTEACLRAMDIALSFRQKFKKDIVIDLICYRRYGHNEGDEPSFTQPLMYKAIKKHPTLKTLYGQQLAQEGSFSAQDQENFMQEKMNNLQNTLDATRKQPPEVKGYAYTSGLWKGLRRGTEDDFELASETACPLETLQKVIHGLTNPPAEFNLNSKVKRLLGQRQKMFSDGQVDWGLGELLAYGSLCLEKTPVRLSGQDVERGTFTHRHAVFHDAETGASYNSVDQISPDQEEFCVYNSPLSEYAVLAFEYGNASSDPHYLTIWEAQFGDFTNGAQIIIDQFIASGEEKWARGCGLVLLLPHGYEGQGPEHSSARLERFLQMYAQENLQICNLTTPANLFHALRRQVRRDFRKPLIVMSPKSLLRHPEVVSPIGDFTDGHFQEVIPDPLEGYPNSIESVVFCSGKVYFDLVKARREGAKKSTQDSAPNEAATNEAALKDTMAVVRVEQMAPFPKSKIAPFLSGYPQLKKVIWLQEEPANMGAREFMLPRLNELIQDLGLKNLSVDFIGRTERASPATGSHKNHLIEQEYIVNSTLIACLGMENL